MDGVRVLSFNVQKKYVLVDALLETSKDEFDIIFLQEPPRQTLRQAPSTSNPLGDDVVGPPKHPSWALFENPTENKPSRVLTYISVRLNHLRPSLRRDLLSHRDIMVVSLTSKDTSYYFANVYSDDRSTAIRYL